MIDKNIKSGIDSLAILGGVPLFDAFKSTSNLVRPDIADFLAYSKIFFDQHRYVGGPLVEQLESRLTDFHRARYCIAVSNGFWALVLSIKCLALQGKARVIMPSLTYRRLADVVSWTGLIPMFCEVDEATLAISPASVADLIDDDTALLLGVHPIINCCDVQQLADLAHARKIPLLFDAVESVFETTNGGRKVGSFGNAECFSMHASKLINGFEGGYITTNDGVLAERLKKMRDFGCGAAGGVEEFGINGCLTEVHAAMALAGFDDLDSQIERNRQRYRCYQLLLKDFPGIRLLEFNEDERTSFKTIVVELTDEWPLSRDATVAILNKERILVRSYYDPPLHKKRMQYPFIPAALPCTERLAKRFMLMPCGHLVSNEDIVAVISLLSFIRQQADQIRPRLQIV